MRFISTVLWALAAVLVALFAYRNWGDVTLNLWGDIQADVKIPILLLATFLLGFLPTWLLMRARLWGCQRRVEALARSRPLPPVPSDAAGAEDEEAETTL